MTSLKRVAPGEAFEPNAETHNAFIDAAIAHRERAARIADGPRPRPSPSGWIRIRNSSGADRDRGEVLVPKIGDETFAESLNLATFYATPIVDCVTYNAAFGASAEPAVLVEPIANGEIGFAAISGVAVAKLKTSGQAANATRVGLIPNETTLGRNGPIQLLAVRDDVVLIRVGNLPTVFEIPAAGIAGRSVNGTAANAVCSVAYPPFELPVAPGDVPKYLVANWHPNKIQGADPRDTGSGTLAILAAPAGDQFVASPSPWITSADAKLTIKWDAAGLAQMLPVGPLPMAEDGTAPSWSNVAGRTNC